MASVFASRSNRTTAVTVLGECGRQNLQCNVAIERGITGSVHLAHTAGPKGGDDLVRAEADAGGEGHEIAVDYMGGRCQQGWNQSSVTRACLFGPVWWVFEQAAGLSPAQTSWLRADH